jgi:hypothetical protein
MFAKVAQHKKNVDEVWADENEHVADSNAEALDLLSSLIDEDDEATMRKDTRKKGNQLENQLENLFEQCKRKQKQCSERNNPSGMTLNDGITTKIFNDEAKMVMGEKEIIASKLEVEKEESPDNVEESLKEYPSKICEDKRRWVFHEVSEFMSLPILTRYLKALLGPTHSMPCS